MKNKQLFDVWFDLFDNYKKPIRLPDYVLECFGEKFILDGLIVGFTYDKNGNITIEMQDRLPNCQKYHKIQIDENTRYEKIDWNDKPKRITNENIYRIG